MRKTKEQDIYIEFLKERTQLLKKKCVLLEKRCKILEENGNTKLDNQILKSIVTMKKEELIHLEELEKLSAMVENKNKRLQEIKEGISALEDMLSDECKEEMRKYSSVEK